MSKLGKVAARYRFCLCMVLLALLPGCATTDHSQIDQKYSPRLPAGISTIEAARADLQALLEKRTSPMRILYRRVPPPSFAEPGAKAAFFKEYPQTQEIQDWDGFFTIDTFGVRILDDRIDLPIQPLWYTDLPGFPIRVENGTVTLSDQIELRLGRESMADARRMGDDLYFIQQKMAGELEKKQAAFQELAGRYRALEIKPPMPEKQRRLVVQANARNEKKEFARAAALYRQAVEVDPVGYPPAYYNLALLSEQMQRFKDAVNYMKQYLLLVPDAKDARSAQDKIYQWEGELK